MELSTGSKHFILRSILFLCLQKERHLLSEYAMGMCSLLCLDALLDMR